MFRVAILSELLHDQLNEYVAIKTINASNHIWNDLKILGTSENIKLTVCFNYSSIKFNFWGWPGFIEKYDTKNYTLKILPLKYYP